MKDNGFPVVILLGIAAFVFVVWFSTTFGLDIPTTFSVLQRLAGFAILFAGCWWLGDDYEPISPGSFWPVLLAVFWACWWPALDHWATKDIPSFVSYGIGQTTLWWNSMYTKIGVFVALIVGGYMTKRL